MDKFYVGAKVVCVNDSSDGALPIKKGKIYIIDAIRKGCHEVEVQLEGVFVFEGLICGKCRANYNVPNYTFLRASRFRLLEPDIELSETRSDEILDLINANT